MLPLLSLPSNLKTRRQIVTGLLAALGASAAACPGFGQVAPAGAWQKLSAAKPLERIAFGSCLSQALPQPIWKSVVAARPDLFVMLGDAVYGDVSDSSMKELKAAYALQAKHPELAEARAQIPFLATWDDHDYGRNDAGLEFEHKAAARALFAEFWGLGGGELPSEGVYRATIVGPPGRRVQIILLDLRTFRSPLLERSVAERALGPGKFKPDPSPDKTMLGAAQWAWLEAELKKPAEIRLIASSTQLLAESHGWERWGHLPAERDRLLKLVATTGAKGVLVLSGDRHRAQIYKRSEGLAYPLVDVTSSALNLTRGGGEPEDAGRLGPMLVEDNFGLISIDWAARKLKAALMTVSGRPGPAIELGFSDLGIAATP